MELPEEIERAIRHLTSVCIAAPGFNDAMAANRNIRNGVEALTAVILSRLREAEAGREEALRERDQFRKSYNACIADMERGGTCKRVYSDVALGHALEETEAARDAALARVERLEKELADIKAAEAAEAERVTAEQRANSIAYLQANIAQMERFMERGEEADPIGYLQWRDRRDRFQQELDAALSSPAPTEEG